MDKQLIDYLSVFEIDLITGTCALLLVGYLFWAVYRKFENDSRAERIAKESTLYPISLATGRNEYELFCQSAKDWSVSSSRINGDFKNYMAHQVMPYYAKDLIRRNQTHIDPSLVKEEEVQPTSWSDWVKALLVFPGSLLLLFSLTFL